MRSQKAYSDQYGRQHIGGGGHWRGSEWMSDGTSSELMSDYSQPQSSMPPPIPIRGPPPYHGPSQVQMGPHGIINGFPQQPQRQHSPQENHGVDMYNYNSHYSHQQDLQQPQGYYPSRNGRQSPSGIPPPYSGDHGYHQPYPQHNYNRNPNGSPRGMQPNVGAGQAYHQHPSHPQHQSPNGSNYYPSQNQFQARQNFPPQNQNNQWEQASQQHQMNRQSPLQHQQFSGQSQLQQYNHYPHQQQLIGQHETPKPGHLQFSPARPQPDLTTHQAPQSSVYLISKVNASIKQNKPSHKLRLQHVLRRNRRWLVIIGEKSLINRERAPRIQQWAALHSIKVNVSWGEQYKQLQEWQLEQYGPLAISQQYANSFKEKPFERNGSRGPWIASERAEVSNRQRRLAN